VTRRARSAASGSTRRPACLGIDPAAVCGTDAGCLARQSTAFVDLHASAIGTATCSPPGRGSGSGSGKKMVTLPTPITVGWWRRAASRA